MGTTTPNFGLYIPADGETGWGTGKVDTNWTIIDSNLTNSLPRNYLAGCQLTNNAGSPNTKIDVAAGQAQDVNNAGAMTLANITKDISATWVVGNAGGLAPSLTLTASTWYHVFVIKRTDTNVVDAYFDSSSVAVNIPAPYTLFRRVGSVLTDAGTLLLAFIQDGDYFQWKVPLLETTSATPGTNAVTQTLANAPLGVLNRVVLNVANAAAGFLAYLSDLATTDAAPSSTVAPLASVGTSAAAVSAGQVIVRTNASAQIRTRNGANARLFIATVGWYDTRGK